MIDALKIKKYYLYFMSYALIGWLYEVFLEVVVYKWGFSDRGVFLGPYCVIYGVGAITFIVCLNKILNYKGSKLFKFIKPFIIFVCCMLIATLIELVASYGLEIITGGWPWQTYADYQYNFQARVALSPSIRFGLGGLLFLYVVQPLLVKFYSLFSDSTISKIFNTVLVIFVIDVIITVITKI